jgi:hypothetical protein
MGVSPMSNVKTSTNTVLNLYISNMLVFLGRAGAALILLLFVISLAMSFITPLVITTAVIALLDAILWYWTVIAPLGVELGRESVTVRCVFKQRSCAWRDLRVFLLYETTRIRQIENTHCFANFRTSQGYWFKVRVRAKDLDLLESIVPESSQGQSIVKHIGAGPRT